MLEKFNCLQILVTAKLIRQPLTVLLAVVQIQHGSHRIHADTVHMELLQPEQRIGDQEILYLQLAVVEDLGTPIRMLPAPWVRMLIDTSAVKTAQAMGICGKMSRHPIQDHAYTRFVQLIDQIHEILRCTVAGSRRIITGHLISPGAVKGMLRNPHQLHMGIFHLFQIFHDLLCKLSVCVKPFFCPVIGMLHKGTDMTFINCHRFLIHVFLIPLGHPFLIFPLKSA